LHNAEAGHGEPVASSGDQNALAVEVSGNGFVGSGSPHFWAEMKLITEFLKRAVLFEDLAADESNPELKGQLEVRLRRIGSG
jgi:hypothetical protein